MTFFEKYQTESTWYGKAMVMEIFHLAMTSKFQNWTLSKTANEFDVSIGLVSENLRLANAIHLNERLLKCGSRVEALKKMNGRHYV